jgi:hypothetical protein
MIRIELSDLDAADLQKIREVFCHALGVAFQARPNVAQFFDALDRELEHEQESRQLWGVPTWGSFEIDCDLSILSKAELQVLRNLFESRGSAFVPVKLGVGALLLSIGDALANELESRQPA